MNGIARRRLTAQHLVAPRLRRAGDVVRALGAVQAQEYGGACWGIGLRAKGLTHADVELAFAHGSLLRTHVLRPTWHFVAPEDARWMLELTGPRVQATMSYYNRRLGLDRGVFRKSHAALERALRDGKQLTRAELRRVLQHAGAKVPTGQHMGNLLLQAELDRLVISGARRGKQFTYALFDERVPPSPPRDRDEGLHELARRYFATRGPATALDFAWWSGLAIRDARRGIEIAGRTLARELLDGREYHGARRTARAARPARTAHLLPSYDELFIGYKDRSAFAERLDAAATNAHFDALIGPVVFVDGQVVGGWRRVPGWIEVRLLVKLSPPEERLVRAATRRLHQFLGEA